MRALALLLVLSPSLAFAKHHGHEKPRAAASSSVANSASEPRSDSVRSTAMVEQADDDERPGSRQKK